MIIYQKWICREDLKANPDVWYLFGDNLEMKGYGGQAKEMRGEPNAIGIPTKISPNNLPKSFLSDNNFNQVKEVLDHIFSMLKDYPTIIVPLDGLGTGLAQLPTKAPKIYKYINDWLERL